MAFKFKTFAAVGALIGSLALVGCGQDEKDPNHIKVGVIVGAEQQVAEVAAMGQDIHRRCCTQLFKPGDQARTNGRGGDKQLFGTRGQRLQVIAKTL